jgi:hypothetical protein
MATFKSFAEFGQAMERMQKDLERDTKLYARAMAERAQSIAHAEAVADLGGDAAFSGWRRGSPIGLVTQLKTIPTGVAMIPTRASAGPWTVANQGRNQGNASGFSGPGINVRTGKTSRTKSGALRKVRARSAKRWNGTTSPKHTADRAVQRMDKELFPIAEKAVKRTIVRHFDVT